MLLNKNELKILEEFTRDYSVGFTGSFIAKKKNLNQKTVSTYLKNLEKDNFLKSKIDGKNKIYSLNTGDRPLIQKFISLIEASKTIGFYKKNPLIKEAIFDINSKGTLAVFGSYAKGLGKKDSDLDLAIIGEIDSKSLKNAEKIYDLEINVKIFPEIINTKDTLIKEIIKDHVLIKEPELFIEKLLALSE